MAGVAYASDLLTAGRALPPATSAGLSVADDVTHARSHFHTLTPLRSGCNAHFDRLRCGSSGKGFSPDVKKGRSLAARIRAVYVKW